MKDGLYRARLFAIHGDLIHDMGTGTVAITGKTFQGGGTYFAYWGSLSSDGDRVRAELVAFPHTEGHRSVFGFDNIKATLSGKPHAAGVTLSGSAPEAPGVRFSVSLTLLD